MADHEYIRLSQQCSDISVLLRCRMIHRWTVLAIAAGTLALLVARYIVR